MITNKFAYFNSLEQVSNLYLSANKENTKAYKGMDRSVKYQRVPDVSFETIVVVTTPSCMWTHGKIIAMAEPKKVIVHRAIARKPKVGSTYYFNSSGIPYKKGERGSFEGNVKMNDTIESIDFLGRINVRGIFVTIMPYMVDDTGRFNPEAIRERVIWDIDNNPENNAKVIDRIEGVEMYKLGTHGHIRETASPNFIIESGRIMCVKRFDPGVFIDDPKVLGKSVLHSVGLMVHDEYAAMPRTRLHIEKLKVSIPTIKKFRKKFPDTDLSMRMRLRSWRKVRGARITSCSKIRIFPMCRGYKSIYPLYARWRPTKGKWEID